MAVKNYTHTELSQRMADLYIDTVRYHLSHWQVLGGSHRSYGTQAGVTAVWANVADDTAFITRMYQSLLRDLIRLEENATMLAALQSVSLANFITAAQTQFLV